MIFGTAYYFPCYKGIVKQGDGFTVVNRRIIVYYPLKQADRGFMYKHRTCIGEEITAYPGTYKPF